MRHLFLLNEIKEYFIDSTAIKTIKNLQALISRVEILCINICVCVSVWEGINIAKMSGEHLFRQSENENFINVS